MTKLTQQQRDDLITQYIEIVVDSMNVDELVNLGMNKLQEEFNSYDLDELKSKIGQYDPELFDELVGFKNSKLKDDDSPGKIPRTAFSALIIPIEVLLIFEIEIDLSP